MADFNVTFILAPSDRGSLQAVLAHTAWGLVCNR